MRYQGFDASTPATANPARPAVSAGRRMAAGRVFIAVGTAAIVTAALAIGNAGVAGAEPATGVAPGDQISIEQSKEYAVCMKLARADPVKGFERAQLWWQRGGKAAAVHCSAVALIGQQQFALAAKTLEHLATDGQGTPVALKGDLLGQAGQAWLMAGKESHAITAFSKAVVAAPGDVELLIDRAFAYASVGRFQDVIDDLSRALELAPRRDDAYLLRAGAYRRVNNLALAAHDVERALALKPDNPDAYLERGLIRRLTGDDPGAASDWRRVLETAPRSAAARDARRNLDGLHATPR